MSAIDDTRRVVDRLQFGFEPKPEPIPAELIDRVGAALRDVHWANLADHCWDEMATAALRAVRAWDYGK